MKFVVFGLSISSSWGNGHATLWRGLVRALAARGDRVVFYEHDTSWYAGSRDYHRLPGGELVLYADWEEVRQRAVRDVADADVAIVTSFCPDGIAATRIVLDAAHPTRVFYDLDTPVTLARLDAGESLPWIGDEGLSGFDLVLSYTGGAALDRLRDRLGAHCVAPLYGHVDPAFHRPAAPVPRFSSHLSWLGTWAEDRQPMLETLLIEPARQRPSRRFLIGGAQYPEDFPWADNILFARHLPPSEHLAFFASSRLTLNITRQAMRTMGWCPSGRLFEAAACGTPLLSDTWEGIETFFTPGEEIMIAGTTAEALQALDLSDAECLRMARAARERVLAEHTSARRVRDLDLALARTAANESDLPEPMRA